MKRTVDATGLACPLPVVETKKALREMSGGELEVIVDNIVSLQNLEKMAKQMGLAYRLETVSDAKHIIHITADESSGEENFQEAGRCKALRRCSCGTLLRQNGKGR